MPDHLHCLIALGEAPLPRVMQSVHSRCARATNAALGRCGALWSGAYHDHALRADEDVLGAARYLVANPLRAGIVTRVGDHPFWDCVWMDSDPNQVLW